MDCCWKEEHLFTRYSKVWEVRATDDFWSQLRTFFSWGRPWSLITKAVSELVTPI